MKIYLARHGQTDWNLQRKAQGQADIPLNATGISQAEELREKLKSIDFDVCYCSPLKRALETAGIAVDGRTEIIICDDMKERNFGELEGTDPQSWDINDYDIKENSGAHGIEPINDLLARSKKVLEFIKSENPADTKVLLVGHGTFFKTLHFNIVGYDENTDFYSFHLKNGDIAEYEV